MARSFISINCGSLPDPYEARAITLYSSLDATIPVQRSRPPLLHHRYHCPDFSVLGNCIDPGRFYAFKIGRAFCYLLWYSLSRKGRFNWW